MEPFIVAVDITDVSELYGRDRQIKILTSCAKRKSNAGIIGVRRFGKTCLLKSMEQYLLSHPETKAFPLYFDPKRFGIRKDTTKVYRTIGALLAATMVSNGLLSSDESLKISRHCSLQISKDELDMMVQIEQWNPTYQKEILSKLCEIVSTKGMYVLLLLDEIDYLLLEALNSPSDFSMIRSEATSSSNQLRFWIAGIAQWSSMCTTVGSPELNCGLEPVTLGLLTKEDFNQMWEHECSLIEDQQIKDKLIASSDKVYDKTGGVPYYAKLVGDYMLRNDLSDVPDYNIIRDYLTEVLNNRFTTDKEIGVLYSLVSDDSLLNTSVSDAYRGLEGKGLLRYENGKYSLGIGYLADYLKAKKQDNDIVNADDTAKTDLGVIINQIERLRRDVNRAYRGNEVFVPSIEDPIEIDTLRIVCNDDVKLGSFASSLYKLYYEGSEKGNNLPDPFINRDFSNMTRALRHLCHHRDCELSSMTLERFLQLTNNGKYPCVASDYFQIQKAMLERFRDELLDIIHFKEESSVSKNYKSNFVRTEEGIYKESYGRKSINYRMYHYQVRSIREGENLYDEANVEFDLCWEPNSRDPSKKFYVAEDVHLKEE